MYPQGTAHPARSPPPLQHPIPTHPRPRAPDAAGPPGTRRPAPRGGAMRGSAMRGGLPGAQRPPVRPPGTRVPPPGARQPMGGMRSHTAAAAGTVPRSTFSGSSGYQRISSPSTPINMYGGAGTSEKRPSIDHAASPNSWYDGADASAYATTDALQQSYTPPQAAPSEAPSGDWAGFATAGGIPGLGGGVMNDATTQMGMQFGRHVAQVGGEYMQKNFHALLPMPVLKHYFNVSNSYVLHKLRIVLFPWRHRPWSRRLRYSTPFGGTGTMSPGPGSYAGVSTPERPMSAGARQMNSTGEPVSYCAPREDVNSPDMYIPCAYLPTTSLTQPWLLSRTLL